MMRLSNRWRKPIGWLVVLASLLVLVWLLTPFLMAYTRYFLLPDNVVPATVETGDTVTGETAPAEPVAVYPSIIIAKLGLNAPIVVDVNTTKMTEYNAALDNGVAHMKGTASLDASTGNTVLFGHSSRVPPKGTAYDTIFATLPQMAVGDTLKLAIAEGVESTFTVTESKVIGPNETSVIASTTDRRVTIITCWPLGTNLKRWVVVATAAQSTAVLADPVADWRSRTTKKPFGLYVEPGNSPVDPENFTGYHTAVDVEYEDASGDVTVRAIADGEIIASHYVNGYGGVVQQVFEVDGQTYTALYGHLDPASMMEVGPVSKEQKIGILGEGYTTETDGERKHLHFGILPGRNSNVKGYVSSEEQLGDWVDPLTLY